MESAVKARVLALSLAACWFLSGAHAACYYPSGRMSPNDTPCRDDTTHSTCCGQGYICLSNGMCQATETELAKEGASEYVRGSCTDKSWRSSSCPLFCIDEEYDFLDGGMGIAKCEDTTENLFFCINGQEASCENNQYLLYYVGMLLQCVPFSASRRTVEGVFNQISQKPQPQSRPLVSQLPALPLHRPRHPHPLRPHLSTAARRQPRQGKAQKQEHRIGARKGRTHHLRPTSGRLSAASSGEWRSWPSPG